MGVVSVVAASDSSKSARQHPSLTRGTPLGQASIHRFYMEGQAVLGPLYSCSLVRGAYLSPTTMSCSSSLSLEECEGREHVALKLLGGSSNFDAVFEKSG